jgi:hypothetical protein
MFNFVESRAQLLTQMELIVNSNIVTNMVFGNIVLRRLFGLRRKEVAGGWRRLHNEELHYMFASPNIIKVIK